MKQRIILATIVWGSAVLAGGPPPAGEGAGASYHLYELVFDPGRQVADLFDDLVRLTDYGGRGDLPQADCDPILGKRSGE